MVNEWSNQNQDAKPADQGDKNQSGADQGSKPGDNVQAGVENPAGQNDKGQSDKGQDDKTTGQDKKDQGTKPSDQVSNTTRFWRWAWSSAQ